MIHWKYWGTQRIGILCMTGMMVHIGRKTQVLTGKPIPTTLWIAVILPAIGSGLQIADLILDPILDRIWNEKPEQSVGRTIWEIFRPPLWIRILVGLVRLESGWRKSALVLTLIGAIALLSVTIWLYWNTRQVSADIAQTAMNQFVFPNGWRPELEQHPANYSDADRSGKPGLPSSSLLGILKPAE